MYNVESSMARIARLVRERRIEKGLTQDQLAKLSEPTEKTIRDFELGNNPNIKLENLESICLALDLYFTFPTPPPLSKEERNRFVNDIVDYLLTLDDEKLRLYYQYHSTFFQPLANRKID